MIFFVGCVVLLIFLTERLTEKIFSTRCLFMGLVDSGGNNRTKERGCTILTGGACKTKVRRKMFRPTEGGAFKKPQTNWTVSGFLQSKPCTGTPSLTRKTSTAGAFRKTNRNPYEESVLILWKYTNMVPVVGWVNWTDYHISKCTISTSSVVHSFVIYRCKYLEEQYECTVSVTTSSACSLL